MTKKEKFRNLITMFKKKVFIGQKFIVTDSFNKIDRVGEIIYDSGFTREELFYKVKTRKFNGLVTDIFLEELPFTDHRIMVTLKEAGNFLNVQNGKNIVNHNIKDLK